MKFKTGLGLLFVVSFSLTNVFVAYLNVERCPVCNKRKEKKQASINLPFGKNPNVEKQVPTRQVHEVHQIAFLKVHKAGSSTVQNMLFRFGLKRNLSFVIPYGTHVISKLKKHYNEILPPFRKKENYNTEEGKFDILCNHAIFNRKKFRKLLPESAVYIAIVREPLSLFLSAAFFYRYVVNVQYLNRMKASTYITDLIHNPGMFEEYPLPFTRTYNTMAHDFGFELNNLEETLNVTAKMFDDYLRLTGEIFTVVMVLEYFDESLVFLKRSLWWDIGDILYIKNNELPKSVKEKQKNVKLTLEDRKIFKERNRLDYQLYDFFQKRFLEQINKEIDFQEEVDIYRGVIKIVQAYCRNVTGAQEPLHLGKTKWHKPIVVTKDDCRLMGATELQFVDKLRGRHFKMLNAHPVN